MSDDEWEDLLFVASYGGLEFDVVSTDDEASRVVARHEFPFRDGAVLQDMGAAPRETRCRIVFMPVVGDPGNHVDRFQAFVGFLQEAALLDVPPVLVHPLTGSYTALPENISFSAAAEDRDYITLEVTFVEAGLDPAAFEATGDESVGAGVAEVSAAAVELDAAIDVDWPDPDLGTDAIAIVTAWRDDASMTTRRINIELAELANRIQAAADAVEIASDVRQYPTYLAVVRVQASLRRAAELAIRTRPKLTEVVAPRTESLLALMTSIYGGTRALEMYARARELNEIGNPGRIVAGTRLTIEQP